MNLNISAFYYTNIIWCADLPEGRSWDDVQSASIKWDTLYITWKDGTEQSLVLTYADEDADTKYPLSFSVTDADYNELAETENSDWEAEKEDEE